MLSVFSNVTSSYETTLPMSGDTVYSSRMCSAAAAFDQFSLQSKRFSSMIKYVFLENEFRFWLLGKMDGYIGDIFLETIDGQLLYNMRADRSQAGKGSLLLKDFTEGRDYRIKRLGNRVYRSRRKCLVLLRGSNGEETRTLAVTKSLTNSKLKVTRLTDGAVVSETWRTNPSKTECNGIPVDIVGRTRNRFSALFMVMIRTAFDILTSRDFS